jgi:diguanylate cyclase (GGDEF)-like protein
MAYLVFVKQHRLGIQLARANHVLEEASLTDPLTGARNRRFFDASIEADVGQTLRAYADNHDQRIRDLIFYVIDADGFKEVNDKYGHDAGDRVLVEMSRRISSAIRNSDILIRWGGEEFLVVSRYTDRAEAKRLPAVCWQRSVTLLSCSKKGRSNSRTCSIGWAAFPWYQEIRRHQLRRSAFDGGPRSWRSKAGREESRDRRFPSGRADGSYQRAGVVGQQNSGRKTLHGRTCHSLIRQLNRAFSSPRLMWPLIATSSLLCNCFVTFHSSHCELMHLMVTISSVILI